MKTTELDFSPVTGMVQRWIDHATANPKTTMQGALSFILSLCIAADSFPGLHLPKWIAGAVAIGAGYAKWHIGAGMKDAGTVLARTPDGVKPTPSTEIPLDGSKVVPQ